jgi:hypothetical protein
MFDPFNMSASNMTAFNTPGKVFRELQENGTHGYTSAFTTSSSAIGASTAP